jgi:hypothetical protein
MWPAGSRLATSVYRLLTFASPLNLITTEVLCIIDRCMNDKSNLRFALTFPRSNNYGRWVSQYIEVHL